jgi:hypothetical protein
MELPAGGDVSKGVVRDAAVSTTIISMFLLLKKFVLAAALIVMPLQGIAATLSVVRCHGEAKAHVMHVDDVGDRTMVGDSQSDNGGLGGNLAYYPCCHNVVSAAPIAAPLAAQLQFSVRMFAPDSLHDLFVPDRPQRPPLA